VNFKKLGRFFTANRYRQKRLHFLFFDPFGVAEMRKLFIYFQQKHKKKTTIYRTNFEKLKKEHDSE
jgi:hypothetical protein